MIFDTKEIVIGGTEWKTAPFRFSKMFTLSGGSGQSYIDVLLSGVSPLALTNALGLNYIKALGATEQRNLPSEYTQVEYIESTGTQYIDTGYIANGGMAIEAKAAPGGTRGSYTFWIGSIGTSTEQPDNTRNAVGANGNSLSWQKGRVYSGAGFALSNNNPVVIYMNTIGNTFEGKANGTTLYVNPSSIQQTLTGLTTTIKIGYSDYSGAARAMTIYYFKMWNNNYELIRNLIPCRRNSDSVLGMYDTVTNTFLTNAGTGDFTAGADVAAPSPDNPIDIVCNNGVVKVSKNLFDVNNVEIQESTAISADGSLVSNSAVNTCITYISVKPNTTYTISGDVLGTDTSFFRLAQYKADKTFISRSEDSIWQRSSYTFTTSVNTYYIRFHYIKSASLNTYQLEKGSTATPYTPYSVTGYYTDGTQETVNIIGKNLFNKDDVAYNNSTILADGSIISAESISVLDYIPVQPNTAYTYSSTTNSARPYNKRIVCFDANKNYITSIADTTGNPSRQFSITGTTPANTKYVRVACSNDQMATAQLEQGSTATTYEPYTVLGTANAEMLLKVGDYKDNQELLTGSVTRNIGIKVLDGTEDWTYNNSAFLMNLSDRLPQKKFMFCTHFNYDGGSSTTIPNLCIGCGSTTNTIFIKYQTYNTAEQFKQYLADQYANGTPVIVVYPLATSTTETVTGQSLTASGNCTVTATGSLNNLELELSYKQSI